MPDFDPSFADNGTKTAPTPTELDQGFQCGPASKELFNYLFNLSQGQVEVVATNAGIASLSDGDKTVLYRAINALIAAAVGGGSPTDFVLLSQATGRMPIYPDVITSDGRMSITVPAAGTVRVPAGVSFVHRGLAYYTTVQEDLATLASNTYHLRWNPTDGFTLNNLADSGYNPSTLAEDDPAFDTTYDDMLVARAVVNSSNVPTVTNLSNMARLTAKPIIIGADIKRSSQQGTNYLFDQTLNWARTPSNISFSLIYVSKFGTGLITSVAFGSPDGIDRTTISGINSMTPSMPVNRYRLAGCLMYDETTAVQAIFDFSA